MSEVRGLRIAMVVAAMVAVTAAALGVGVRSTNGGQAAVDEPEYLMTALSLWEDGNLDISDERREGRWREFHDAALPVQTQVQPDGSETSPHDPLLPMLIAVPMGLGGFVAAKLTLALLAGAVAALAVWVAVRRFAVPPWLAGAGVAVAFASPPLAVYGQQVYPELPAAGLALVVVAVFTGRLTAPALVVATSALVGLPWLSVKYVPVAAVLAGLLLWRLWRDGRGRVSLAVVGALGLAGVAYLGLHQVFWGGWTVYASGDFFQSTGEFSAVGADPNYPGRSLRLVGLMFDRTYGIAPWQLAWLLALVAIPAIWRRRPPGAAVLVLPALAAWAVATWMAVTMSGFWWPGRQLVVVLPLVLLCILWWLAHVAGPRMRVVAALLGASGVIALAALLVDGWVREITWVTGFAQVDDPLYAVLRPLLPDYSEMDQANWTRHIACIGVMAVLAVFGWRSAAPPDKPPEPAERLTHLTASASG